MTGDNNFLVSVDIGSSKIVVLLAEENNGRLEVFGYSKGDSAGVKKGLIVDVEQASNAIKKVAEDAYLSCNTIFHNVIVNISDPHLRVVNREGQTTVSGSNINERDVESAVRTAQAVRTPKNKQVISSSVSNRYTLDKDPDTHQGVVVEQPIGQVAATLEASVHIVSVSNQCVNVIDQTIRESNLGLSTIVLNSMASSETYITQDEKDDGVCLIDIGSGVINLSVFTHGNIIYCADIQVGGDQITQDIAFAFNTSFDEAERLKIDYGIAQVKSIREDKLIKFQQIDDSKSYYHYLSYQSMIEVIERSYLDLFSLIKLNLESKSLDPSTLKSGFVLTGGASKIGGCDELLVSYLTVRSKKGRVNIERITADHNILDPVYAGALGLLLCHPDESEIRWRQSDNDSGLFGKIMEQFNF